MEPSRERPGEVTPALTGHRRGAGRLVEGGSEASRLRLPQGLPGLLALVLAGLATLRYALSPWRARAPEDARYPYQNSVMTDFRDTVLLPLRALSRGVDPYNVTHYHRAFPQAQEFDPYMPWWLSVTRPIGHLGWSHATLVWSSLLALATSVGAWWAWRRMAGWRGHRNRVGRTLDSWGPGVVGLLAVVFQWVWRPTTIGQGLGNIGALVGLAALVALLSRHDGWFAPALALAWVKPQFGIPVVLVLLVRGQWRRALSGTALAVLASLPMVVQLSRLEGGVGRLVRTVVDSTQSLGARRGGEPLEGRVDLAALLDRLGWHPGMVVVMVVGSVLLFAAALRGRHLAASGRPAAATALVVLGLLVGFPHIHYDLAMLAPVVLWVLVESPHWRDPAALVAIVLSAVCLLPGQILLGGVGMTSLQGAVVQLCYLALWVWAFMRRDTPTRPQELPRRPVPGHEVPGAVGTIER